jgi:hypothetical protein
VHHRAQPRSAEIAGQAMVIPDRDAVCAGRAECEGHKDSVSIEVKRRSTAYQVWSGVVALGSIDPVLVSVRRLRESYESVIGR